MTRNRLLSALLLPALSGCIYLIPAEGVFGISGNLPAAARDCELVLFSEDGVELRFTRRRVIEDFKERFQVAPHAAVYRASVFCGGAVRTSTTVRYGTEVKPGQYVALGAVATP